MTSPFLSNKYKHLHVLASRHFLSCATNLVNYPALTDGASWFVDWTCGGQSITPVEVPVSPSVTSRNSCGSFELDVDRGIMVSIELYSAMRAPMQSFCQCFRDTMPTIRTVLRRVLGRDENERFTGAFSLVSRHTDQCAPRRIEDRFGKVLVFDHTANIEVFKGQPFVGIYERLGKFVEEVVTLVCHFDMCFAKYEAMLCPVTRPLRFSAMPTLDAIQAFLCFTKKSGRGSYLARGQGDEIGQSEVDTCDLPISHRNDIRHIHRQRHKPLICSVSGNRAGFDLCFFGDGPVKNYADIAYARQSNLSITTRFVSGLRICK